MRFTYLISNFIPVGVGLILLWNKRTALLKKIVPIISVLALVGLVNALAEGPAMSRGIWFYNEPKTFGMSILGVKLETFLFCVLVAIGVGSAAIIFTNASEKRRRTSYKRPK